MADRQAVIVGREIVLLERVETALTGWQRFRGLMLRKELPAAEGLLMPDCWSVHTCFMRFPIDLIYLDGEDRAVKIVHGMKPWRFSVCMGARSVLEMRGGRAQEFGLQAGDRLRLKAEV